MHKIIFEDQSAFIPRRMITDNILIAHELLHSLHTKHLVYSFMAWKSEISKAFDKVEWSFIDVVMQKMGFNDAWRRWIMTCLSTVTYSVLINGCPSRKIVPQCGIRQGDPISSYLYLICLEGLSRLIKTNVQRQRLHGFKAARSSLEISHLFFADDSLLFCQATQEECQNLLQVLNLYKQASGQEINYQKSTITFGKGVPPTVQYSIIQISRISKKGGFGRYLGLPEHIGKSRYNAFAYIEQRIHKKLVSWYVIPSWKRSIN